MHAREHPIARAGSAGRPRRAAKASTVHIADVQADPDYTLRASRHGERCRTMLGVPLLREGR